MRRKFLLLLAMLSLAACGQTSEPGEARPGTVTVYAGYIDVERVQASFAGFTEETGVRVIVKAGDPKLIVDAVIANNGAPPADVLLTPDVAGIWRAAEESGLRALSSEPIQREVAARLRDPDNLWTAASYRSADLVHNARFAGEVDASDYTSLGAESLRGRVCLSSSSLAINRALIAMLIAEHDIRATERIVRGWIRNLAQPVFGSEADLLEAINEGDCGIGIASSTAFQEFEDGHPGHALVAATPPGAFLNVEGIGVARHARNPQLAQQLVEWHVERVALSEQVLEGTSNRNVGLAGWHDEDAELLAERALYP